MKNILVILLFWVMNILIVSGQDILVIGDKNISLNEFKSLFYKNYNNENIDKEYLDEYMDLFINFKLKVINAEDMKMDTIQSFVDELEGYKKQLSKPYLSNKDFDSQMILEAYERMKYDIKVSHILISIDKDINESEKLAYDEALSIRNQILSKKISFSDAAKKYSDDKSVLENSGNLGYFTAFMMVYDFETAAYNTDIGEITMPIRTKYGYHLIKVYDKRSAFGQVEVAHIMFKTGEGADDKRVSIAKDKINQAYEKIQNGQDFSEVAELFSEDRQTAVKGGLLPPFGVGKFVPEFEEVVASLIDINEVSKPFRTNFGWHIVKLINREGIPLFKDIETDIKRKIERDSRSNLSKEALFTKLREEYVVKNNVVAFKKLRRIAVREVSSGNWNGVFNNVDQDLLFIDSKAINIGLFIQYLLENQSVGSNFDDMYIDFVNNQLLEYEEQNLPVKYPEYASLLNEYREGILLFNLMEKKVWKKAVEDTIGLKKYFEDNIHKYMWGERVNATIYTCGDISVLNKLKAQLFLRNIGLLNNDQFLKAINKDSSLDLQFQTKDFSRGENKYLDQVEWSVGVKKNVRLEEGNSDNSFIVIDIHDLLVPAKKDLNNIRGKVISDYQAYLESEWLSLLKSQYNIYINRDVLYSLIK